MLRTHRQRVPAMLAVACVGMMVYAVAGAAPDDGQQLAPAEATAPAAKDGSDSTKTTDKDGKAPDDCKGSTTSTTRKDGDGKDGDGKGTTTTTSKDGDGKDGDGKGTTTTTSKDGDSKGDSGSTPTTVEDDKGDASTKVNAAAVSPAADKGETTTTTAKDDDGSDKDGSGKDDPADDCTPTTGKGGKGSTTTTTKKDGDGKDGGKDTTTTTDRKDRPTTTTTERQTVQPTTPSGGDTGSGGSDSGGGTDPNSTPIEPQEAPPFDPSYDEPADGPEVDFGGEDPAWYEMPDEGPVAEDEEYAFGPIAAPGEAEPVIPKISGHRARSGGKASAADREPRRRSGRGEEVASAPLVISSSGAVQASPGQSQSAAVSKRLGGLQTSANESALPASVISTPKVFPINRRDPLAAAALVLLVGVTRELFRAWRRRASDFWPA